MKIASKSSPKYKQVTGVALADQEMRPGWSIITVISPETNLKCSQKQPKTQISYGGGGLTATPKLSADNFGSLRSPHTHSHNHIDIKIHIYKHDDISCVHPNNSWLRPWDWDMNEYFLWFRRILSSNILWRCPLIWFMGPLGIFGVASVSFFPVMILYSSIMSPPFFGMLVLGGLVAVL